MGNGGPLGTAKTGRREEARILLGLLRSRSETEYLCPTAKGVVHFGLGELDAASEFLEYGSRHHDTLLVLLGADPLLEPLWRHARFEALRRRLNDSRIQTSSAEQPLISDWG
jgi:hypothetical protein